QPQPQAEGHDLLVKVEAVSVNPIDYKIRQQINDPKAEPRVLGWDAAGIVEAVGESTSLFKIGDRVFYAGDITRSGSNADYQLVDERIVGFMPSSLDFDAAAALPLTSITAWEALFDRLKINPETDAGKRLLIIGAAGGVGSIAIQLAKKIAKLQVVATASRAESRQWCLDMGADEVIDHPKTMPTDFVEADYILCLNDTDAYFKVMTELVAPQGMICSVVATTENHDIDLLKMKSAGFVWELMFTRSLFKTADMTQQHRLLNKVSTLIDAGEIRTTLTKNHGKLSAKNIAELHAQLETGSSIGKFVLTN
ncbi:MAG: zinc-binding alcohol dehydrogenase family protein, partial [Methyloprofundus sp.]|nr:zinc-binding alcohol dehydrogenase family protein [Methyloprofundus sp.]